MKRTYRQPETITLALSAECHLMEPTNMQVDDEPKIPIGVDDGEDPTGAKGLGFSDDFE